MHPWLFYTGKIKNLTRFLIFWSSDLFFRLIFAIPKENPAIPKENSFHKKKTYTFTPAKKYEPKIYKIPLTHNNVQIDNILFSGYS